MIKVLEKDFLDDDFIIKPFVSSIKINDNIYFSKKYTYYFGNYKESKISEIKQKLKRNKKRIIKAIENGIKFIICGNSIEIFNNDFMANGINLFTVYTPSKNTKSKNKITYVDNLNNGICASNFKYKNLLCISKIKKVEKLLKN